MNSLTNIKNNYNDITSDYIINKCCVKSSFINTLYPKTTVDFNYNDGIYRPNGFNQDLSNILDIDNLLTMQPECDICVNIIFNKDSICETIKEKYLWKNTQNLSDILTELNINKDDLLKLTIIIVDIILPLNIFI